MERITGRVWKVGDDVDTDAIAPFGTLTGSWDAVKASMLRQHRAMVQGARSGDIVVAGRNFGCGSSRENAAENLKRLGLGAVVAESMGRIFFRNAIAIALPVMVCPGIRAWAVEGEDLELDLVEGIVRRGSASRAAQAHSATTLEILRKGGLMRMLAERRAAARKPSEPRDTG